MTFKTLLDDWAARKTRVKTKASYAVKLPINDAARIDALTEMFPGIDRERVITDLLSAALDYLRRRSPTFPATRSFGKTIRVIRSTRTSA